MHSLFERKAWTGRLRRLDFHRVAVTVLLPLAWLAFVALGRRRSFYRRIIANCNAACFIECWTVAEKGKLIDIDSPLADKINNAIDYYLTRAVYARGEFGTYERFLLGAQYARWFTRDRTKPDEHRARNFAAEHENLAAIFEKYENLHNYVCFTASKEIEKLEVHGKEPISEKYWRSRVRFDLLPRPLTDKTKASAVRKFFADLVRELKLSFARANYAKLDFTLSDLTTLATLCGVLLLVLGYVRIFILGAYFGFPFQNYFGVGDYLATSLNSTGQVLLGAALAGVSGYVSIATSNSYSVQQTEMQTNSTPARIMRFGYHFVGLSAVVAALLAYFRLGYFDTSSALWALVYVGVFAISRASIAIFENPLKAYVVMSMIYFSFAATLTGAFGEIDRLNHPRDSSTKRMLQFEDARYDEKEWQIIAFTADYVILRNRQTQQLVVRPRKDLKSIEAG
jgi:hypothetical protein